MDCLDVDLKTFHVFICHMRTWTIHISNFPSLILLVIVSLICVISSESAFVIEMNGFLDIV